MFPWMVELQGCVIRLWEYLAGMSLQRMFRHQTTVHVVESRTGILGQTR
jgi:hypothetical protein